MSIALWIIAGVLALVILNQIRIQMKIDELISELNGLRGTVTKIKTEVQKLIDASQNADLPQAAVDALTALKAALTEVDDQNPDAPTDPTNPGSPDLPQGRTRNRG